MARPYWSYLEDSAIDAGGPDTARPPAIGRSRW